MRVFKKCNSFLSKSLATHKYIKTNCNTFFTVLNHTQIKLRRYCREQVDGGKESVQRTMGASRTGVAAAVLVKRMSKSNMPKVQISEKNSFINENLSY